MSISLWLQLKNLRQKEPIRQLGWPQQGGGSRPVKDIFAMGVSKNVIVGISKGVLPIQMCCSLRFA